jgi:hypothetical protein
MADCGVGYRAEPLHVNSVRAGYLDLDGCAIVDLLPRYCILTLCPFRYSHQHQRSDFIISSSFIPTCAECSTTYTRPGVTSVRGETSIAFCQSCHRKMSMIAHHAMTATW